MGLRWPLDLSRVNELRDAYVVRDVNRPLRVPPRMMHGSQGDESTQVGVAGVGLLCSAKFSALRGVGMSGWRVGGRRGESGVTAPVVRATASEEAVARASPVA